MPYPDFEEGDVLSAADLNNLVNSVQSGTATVSGNGTTYASVPVTFDAPFTSPPHIVVGSETAGSTTNTAVMVGKAVSVTTTGFVLALKATTSFSASYVLPWIAVGPR